MTDAAFDYDFFISRRGSQAGVAQEVLDALVEGGWDRARILVQEKDLPPGVHFLDWMHQHIHRARHLIVVLSRDYDDSAFTRQYEFLTFLAVDGTGTRDRRVIVLRAEDCKPPGLMRGFIYQDLARERDADKRRQLILDAAEGRISRAAGTAGVFKGVPDRLPYFAGRDELLQDLHRKLTGAGDDGADRDDGDGGDRAAAGQVAVTQALKGMGGVGKTMLAAEYAHRYAPGYAGVWWAPAERQELLTASLAELAGHLDARWQAAQDQDAAARAALDLLRPRGALTPWLLIYDNVEKPQDLNGLRPPTGAHLLVTTRFENWPGAHTEVGTFDRPISVKFLQERAGRDDPDGAGRLADKLGDLPLALDHAAAFCAEAALTFDQYAEHLDAFLPEKPESAGYHGRHDAEATVYGTFAVAIDRAEEQCPEAGQLIELLAVLGAEPVPLDLFDDALPLAKRAKAMQALTRVALVQSDSTDTGDPALTLHRLVARVAQGRAEVAGRLDPAVMRATEILAQAFPDDAYSEPAHWPRCAALLPHVLALRAHWTEQRTAIAAADLANRAGGYLLGRGALDGAETVLSDALAIGRRVLAPKDSELGTLANNLALLLSDRGKLDAAEPLFREAIQNGEAAYSRNHTEVAVRLNNLASLLEQRGKLDEAEPLYREALQIDEATYGRDHPDVAIDLSNLANLLRQRGKLDAAEPLYREALATFDAALGAEHPNTIAAANNYAVLLDTAGRADEADALRRRYPGGDRA